MRFVELQKTIKTIFSDSQVKLFKDFVVKDKNGYNWVLHFHELRTINSLIFHTRFIFKLDDQKKNLRVDDFLYLKDIPNTYSIIKFSSLGDLQNIMNDILSQNNFGINSKTLNELLIQPEIDINNYLSTKNITGYTVFGFEYLPLIAENKFKFKLNVNNNQDFEMIIQNKDNKFNISFNHKGKIITTQTEDLKNIIEIIANFIIKNMEVF